MKVKDKIKNKTRLATVSRIKGVNMRERLENTYVDPYEAYGEFEVPKSNSANIEALKDEMELNDLIEDWNLSYNAGAAIAALIKATSPRFNSNDSLKALRGIETAQSHIDSLINRYRKVSTPEGSEQ